MAYIYFYLSSDYTVLYVGQTRQGVVARYKQHLLEEKFKKAMINELWFIEVSYDILDIVESSLIINYKPVLNKTYKKNFVLDENILRTITHIMLWLGDILSLANHTNKILVGEI